MDDFQKLFTLKNSHDYLLCYKDDDVLIVQPYSYRALSVLTNDSFYG